MHLSSIKSCNLALIETDSFYICVYKCKHATREVPGVRTYVIPGGVFVEGRARGWLFVAVSWFASPPSNNKLVGNNKRAATLK